MNFISRNIVALLMLTINFVINGQVMPVRSLTTHDGLPQIQITSIFEDSRGLIWVGTKGGLAYYNGVKFSNISQDFLDDPTFAVIVGELPDGSILFFRSRKSSLFRFDGAEVTEFFIKGVKNNIHSPMLVDNHLYFRYKMRSPDYIFKLNLHNNTQDSINVNGGLFYSDSGNEYKLVNQKEIHIFKNKRWILLKEAPIDVEFSLNPLNVKNPFILEINNKKNITTAWAHDMKTKYFTFVSDANGNITKIESLSALNGIAINDDKVIYFLNGKKVEKLHLNNQTTCGYLVDKNKNLWHASENGLQVFGTNGFETLPLEICRDVWSFHKTKKNEYYYSGYGQGVFQFSVGANNTIFKSKTPIPKGTNNLFYYTSVERNSNMYFAHSQGVMKYKNKKLSLLSGSKITLGLKYDSTENVIYSGIHSGFAKVDSNDIVEIFENEVFEKRYTTSIVSLKDRLFLGSYYKFIEYDKLTKTYTDLTPKFEDFGYRSAISLESDSSNRIWVGTIKGLFYFNLDTYTFTPVLENIINKNVVAIKNIHDSILCVGTNNELIFINLFNFNKDKPDFKIFNHLNGFVGEEVTQNGIFLDYTDTLWIPSATYLTKIALNDISFTENRGHVRFSSFNEHLIPWGHRDSLFTVTHSDLNFSLESYGFLRPDKMVFQFKVNDGIWSEWVGREYFTISNLPSGIYDIYIRAKHGSKAGMENVAEDILKIRINLPFYKEPHFHLYALGIGIVFMLFTFIYFWFYRLYRVKSHERENRIKFLQIHTLQSQLNPHFLFNVLGTIQSLVVNDDKETANKYLVSFSKLIRRFLDSTVQANSTLDSKGIEIEVTLNEEIEMLQLYLDFEKLQYLDKFEYTFNIDKEIDTSVFTIPPMILQPFIENAIKHGLMYLQSKGKLEVKFYLKDDSLVCEILDNGVGRKKAAEIQTSSIKLYKSRGIDLVMERINILNTLSYDIRIFIEDLYPSGTRVNIFFNFKK